MKKDIEWLVKMINEELDILRQRLESGKGTSNQNTFDEGRGWALSHVLRMMYYPDKLEELSQELPVIPKYVAEHLDFAKSDVPLMRSKNNVISLWRHKETGEKHLQYESFSDLNHQDVLEKWEVQLDGYNRLEDGFNTVYSQHVVHQINITLNEMGVYKNHEIELHGDPVKGILTRKEVYEFIDKAMGV